MYYSWLQCAHIYVQFMHVGCGQLFIIFINYLFIYLCLCLVWNADCVSWAHILLVILFVYEFLPLRSRLLGLFACTWLTMCVSVVIIFSTLLS